MSARLHGAGVILARKISVRRVDPELFARVQQWMSPAEWLQLRLTGDANCAIGMAAGTGIVSPCTLTWEAALLERVGFPRRDAPLTDEPTAVVASSRKNFPSFGDVPWFPASATAPRQPRSGATRPGLAAINVGTSAALRVMRGADAARRSALLLPGRCRASISSRRREKAEICVPGACGLRCPTKRLEAELAPSGPPGPRLAGAPVLTAERPRRGTRKRRASSRALHKRRGRSILSRRLSTVVLSSGPHRRARAHAGKCSASSS